MRIPLTRLAQMTLCLALSLAGCDGGGEATGGSGRATPQKPNVLLISIDSLRVDHLRCYGAVRETSPNMDRLASEGVLFEKHISSTSWTLPAHAAMFTSLSDSVHGCTDTDRKLADDLVTLAERFGEAGFRTAGFFSGPYLHPAFGLDQGFESYQDCASYAHLTEQQPASQWAMGPRVMRRSHQDITNPTVSDAVRGWLRGNRDEQFFMFVHMWDVHFDFIPPAPYDTVFDAEYAGDITGRNFFFNPRVNPKMAPADLEHIKALYDGEIAWTDHHVGLILDELRLAGELDNTVIAITSDHGTEFFEHGKKGHRMTLFDEVLRIPLVIRCPWGLPAGARVASQTRMIDLGPTLLELAGLSAAQDMMGRSLVTLARGGPLDFDNAAVSELFSVGRRLRSVRTGQWKIVENLKSGKRWYVNLSEDPDELNRIRDLTTPIGQSLNQQYSEITSQLSELRARMNSGPDESDIPPDVMRQLKGLGYVGDEPP